MRERGIIWVSFKPVTKQIFLGIFSPCSRTVEQINALHKELLLSNPRAVFDKEIICSEVKERNNRKTANFIQVVALYFTITISLGVPTASDYTIVFRQKSKREALQCVMLWKTMYSRSKHFLLFSVLCAPCATSAFLVCMEAEAEAEAPYIIRVGKNTKQLL